MAGADNLWAVHAHGSSAIAAVSASEIAEVDGGGFGVTLHPAAGRFSTGGESVESSAHSFYRGGVSHLHH